MSIQLAQVATHLPKDIYEDMQAQHDQSVNNMIHTKQLLAKARQDQIRTWKEQAYTESAMIATAERTTITSIQKKDKHKKYSKRIFAALRERFKSAHSKGISAAVSNPNWIRRETCVLSPIAFVLRRACRSKRPR